jgi:polyhydroxyalkanoate synthase subunit PhaE
MSKTDFMDSMLGDIKAAAGGYWQGVKDLAGQLSGGMNFGASAPWGAAMNMFKDTFSGAANADAASMFNQVNQQGKAYLDMMQSMMGGTQAAGGFDFHSLAEQYADQLKSWMGMNSAMPDIAAWQKQFAGMFGMDSAAMLELPAFGYQREHIERAQKLLVDLGAYQESTKAYNGLLTGALHAAADRMQSKLAERTEPGRGLESMKALYDLWIDALEETYAETALSQEFQTAYGALVNAQMRVRSGVQKQVEHITGQLGMPSRTEVDQVHLRLTQMRREMRAINADAISELRAEVAQLRKELTTSRAAKTPATVRAKPAATGAKAKAKPVVRPAAAAKKPVGKKPAPKPLAKKAKPAARKR